MFEIEQHHLAFKIYLKMYLMFIPIIHVPLPLITSIQNLLGYQFQLISFQNRTKSVERNTSNSKKSSKEFVERKDQAKFICHLRFTTLLYRFF